MNIRTSLSVSVTPAEHQLFTNAWRTQIAYGEAGTEMATAESVIQAARKIYSEHPAIMRALDLR
jgi:hypothetical protein